MSKTNKRGTTSGYCQENIGNKIALMKRYHPGGDWRRIDKTSNKIVMSYLLQTWNYSGEELGTVKHLYPWEMKDTITSMSSDKKCKNKLALKSRIKQKTKNKDLIKISVTGTGPHTPLEYCHLFCQTCESDPKLLKALVKKHEVVLGPKPIVFTLIRNFDSLKILIV